MLNQNIPLERPTAAVDFDLTLDQVNWLSNVVSFVFVPASFVVSIMCKRWGIRAVVSLSSIFFSPFPSIAL